MSGENLYYPWADIASDAGLVVKVTSTNAGWERRARSSGGFPSAPLGVMWHHAASSLSTSDEECVDYECNGNPDAPVGNMTLGRNGDVWPVAGGASNCSGKGGPMDFSRGTCPQDQGNTHLVNIEVNNTGVGEPWSSKLIDAYFAISNAINAHLTNQPSDVTSHALGAGDGYTNRKIDPARAEVVEGLWRPRSVNSSGTWSLADMRDECERRWIGGGPPTPQPPPIGDDDVEFIIGYAGTDTDGAMYSTSGHTKTWLADDGMVKGKESVIALNGGDPSARSIPDRDLFRAYGPVVGPRPERSDEWGLPSR